MKILIENHETQEFFTATGQWTKNPLDARIFPATKAAFRVAKQEAINKFNIVFYIAGTNQFVNLDHGRGTGLPESGDSSSQ